MTWGWTRERETRRDATRRDDGGEWVANALFRGEGRVCVLCVMRSLLQTDARASSGSTTRALTTERGAV